MGGACCLFSSRLGSDAASDSRLLLPIPCSNGVSKNWLKIRVFDLVQYDAVLLVDSDVAVVRPLQELFSLPTHFAAARDQGPG